MAILPRVVGVLLLVASAHAAGMLLPLSLRKGLAFRGGDAHIGGACGYIKPFPANETFVAGVSSKLYDLGRACGQCFKVTCAYNKKCIKGASVTVTVVNECSGGRGKNASGPCTRGAFNLQPQAFDRIVSDPNVGLVYANFAPVPCQYKGGVQIAVLVGNNYYLSVLVQNVGGPGNLKSVEVAAGGVQFKPMSLNYGQVWHIWNLPIHNKNLSFRITAWNGKRAVLANVIPAKFVPRKVYATTRQLV